MDNNTMEYRIGLEKQNKRSDQVTELILDNCRAPQISGLTDEFVNLEVLSLINVGLATLKGFPKLPKLKKLELSDNRLTSGLNLLHGSPKLQHLNISGNRIKDMEALEPLKEFHDLVNLDLYNCDVTKSDDYRRKVFDLLPNLHSLDGYDRNEREVPDSDESEDEGSDIENRITRDDNDLDDDDDDDDDDEEDDSEYSHNDEEYNGMGYDDEDDDDVDDEDVDGADDDDDDEEDEDDENIYGQVEGSNLSGQNSRDAAASGTDLNRDSSNEAVGSGNVEANAKCAVDEEDEDEDEDDDDGDEDDTGGLKQLQDDINEEDSDDDDFDPSQEFEEDKDYEIDSEDENVEEDEPISSPNLTTTTDPPTVASDNLGQRGQKRKHEDEAGDELGGK